MTLGAFSSVTGMEVLEAGKYFNALLIFLLGLVLVAIFKKLKIDIITTHSLLILLLFSLPITVYIFFWSEGLFLLLSCITIYIILEWINNADPKLLFLAGIFSGLFLMTRFVGAGFIIGFAVFVFFSKGNIYKKVKNTIIYSFPIVLSVVIWHFYTASFNEESMNRKFLFHMITWGKIKAGFSTIYSWFISYSFVSLPLIFTILVFYLFELKKSSVRSWQYVSNYKKPVFLLFLLILCYLLFMAVAMLFFDTGTSLDNRRLTPIFPVIIIILSIVFNYFFSNKNTIKVTVLLMILLITNVSMSSYDVWISHYNNGTAFTNKTLRNSEVLKTISKDKETTIFSNSPHLLRFYSDSDLEFLPRKFHKRVRIPTSTKNFKKELRNMKEVVDNGDGEIVYINKPRTRRVMEKDEILKTFKNYEIIQLKDGFIVQKPK